MCFHTQWEVFFQIKFHRGMKFYWFHIGMKLTCKQNFFISGQVSSRDEISSRLHVNTLLDVKQSSKQSDLQTEKKAKIETQK